MSDQIVVKLVEGFPNDPNDSAIAVLEAALSRARSGDTIGALVIEQAADKSACWDWGGVLGSYSLVGAVKVALHNLLLDHEKED